MPYKTGSWGIQAKKRNKKRFSKSLGKKGELEAIEILGLEEKLERGSLSDLKWRNKFLDVKTDIFDKKRNGWQFDCTKQKGKIDYFLLIAKNINQKTEYIFLIPDKDFITKYLWISPRNINNYMRYLWKVR